MPITKTRRINKDGSVTIRYRADAGKDPLTGKRRRKSFDLRGKADEWIKNRPPEIVAGTTTMKELGKAYVKDRRDAKRERSTWTKYKEHFKNHICAIVLSDGELKGQTLKHVKIGVLRPRHFMQLKADLVRTRSHQMALKVWSTLQAALELAVATELVEVNCAASIKIDRKTRISEEDHVLIPTKADIAILHNALQPRPGEPLTFGQVFVLTIMATGLRPSEERALRWPSLSIDGPADEGRHSPQAFGLKVVERVDEWNQVGNPKSAAGHRWIPLPASVARLLKEWRLACPKSGKRNLVFPTAGGHYQNPANIHNRIWAPLQKALGLADPVLDSNGHQVLDADGKPKMRHRYTLYSLRHAYASIQIELGMDAKTMQARMGHSSIQLTLDTYGHLWRDPDRDAADMSAIEAWFAGLPKGI
jgi:integrase